MSLLQSFSVRSIPAHAGSSPTSPCRRTKRRVHPRTHGEQFTAWVRASTARGPSPHVRGAGDVRVLGHLVDGSIPAGTGNTTPGTPCSRGTWDHPRRPEEHRPARKRSPKAERPPPSTGSTSTTNRRPAQCSNHTHTRRKQNACPARQPSPPGSIPARGKQPRLGKVASTSPGPSPRARGRLLRSAHRSSLRRDHPPRVRGAVREIGDEGREFGSIPARQGAEPHGAAGG